jgi:tripartite ATP-independent transporter DctP family solute receptor
MKRIFSILLAVGVCFAITACGGESAAPADDTASSGEEAQTEATTDETVYELSLSYVQNEQDPLTKGLYELADKVAERSNGRLVIKVFHSGQLGDTAGVLEQARLGTNIGLLTDAGRFSDFLPEIGILDAPYLFDTYDEGKKIVDSELFNDWFSRMPDKGYRVLSFNWYQGSRAFSTNKAINTLADLKNLKIRTTDAKIAQETMKALGINPMALTINEVYSGMQQKVVDGADQHIMGIYGNKLYEVGAYIAKTGHYQVMTGLVVSEDWFQSLPDDLKTILVEEAENAGDFASNLTLTRIGEMESEMAEAGVIFTEPDLTEFKEATAPVYDQFEGYTEYREEFNRIMGR